jgi:hypothetical protein
MRGPISKQQLYTQPPQHQPTTQNDMGNKTLQGHAQHPSGTRTFYHEHQHTTYVLSSHKQHTVRLSFDQPPRSSNEEKCNSTETRTKRISTCEVRTASSNYTHGYRSTNQPLKTTRATRHSKAMLSIPATRALSTKNISTQLTACHPRSTIRSDCVLINRHIARMKRNVTVARHDTTQLVHARSEQQAATIHTATAAPTNHSKQYGQQGTARPCSASQRHAHFPPRISAHNLLPVIPKVPYGQIVF